MSHFVIVIDFFFTFFLNRYESLPEPSGQVGMDLAQGKQCYEIKLRAQFSILVIKKGNAR